MKRILFESPQGISFVREDYKLRSKVSVRTSKGFLLRTYRFNNVEEYTNSQYISWANLNCCNGWQSDELYQNHAIQDDKKLVASLFYCCKYENEFEAWLEKLNFSKEVALKIRKRKIDDEFSHNDLMYNVTAVRRGRLDDFYDFNDIMAYYKLILS